MRNVFSRRSEIGGLRSRVMPLLATLLLAAAPGCGGSGGGGGGSTSTPTPTPTPMPTPSPTPAARSVFPQITIQWGVRSRATTTGSSALSVVATLHGAAADGSDVTITADRNTASPSAYAQAYASTTLVREGTYPLTVVVYGQPDGAQPVVSQGSASATIGDSGVLPTVTLTGTIVSVTVPAGQSVLVNQSTDLTVTAFDSSHAIVPVTAGSIFLTSSDTTVLSNTTGGATVLGVRPGTAMIGASIDGISSATTAVSVTSNVVVAITPANPPVINVGNTISFTAMVYNAPSTGVIWSIQEGAAGGTITAAGVYTAPNTTGTYHIFASSQYDPTRQAMVPVSVENGSVTVGVGFPGSGGVTTTIN